MGNNTLHTPQTVTVYVLKATPVITWANPPDIVYETALSGIQLNAAVNVAGTIVYTPPSGTILNAGNGQELKVSFTPTDTANYSNANATVTINVAKANPAITWAVLPVLSTALRSAVFN